MRRNMLMAAGLAVSSVCVPAWSQPSTEVAGRIDEVTVYRGQALVTRVVAVPGQGGLQEIVVTGLPEAVAPASLYVDTSPGVRVRSIRYRERPVERDVREEVKAIDRQIEETMKAQRDGEQQARLLSEERAYLAQLEQFGGQTAMAELRSGVLDAGTIKSLSEFIFAERERLSRADLAQQERARELGAQLEQLQRERATVAGATARTVREAVLFVEVDGANERELRLRYLVNQATWEPSYTVRTDESHLGVTVEYFAAIQQLSGEDWGDVSMTLSTATASLVARAPELTPLRVALAGAAPEPSMEQAQSLRDSYVSRKSDVEMRRQQASSGPSGGTAFGDFDEQLNRLAANLWLLDVTTEAATRSGASPSTPEDSRLSVTYSVGERTSLPSRTDRQQVQIAAIPMEAEFYKLVAPALTSQVYDEARIVNASELVLLPGPVSTYVGGRFVGYGEAPMVASRESFTLGFGIDASLRCSRELIERSEDVQGGNRIVDLAYRLTVQNFGREQASIRLLDRMPTLADGDIRITLLGDEERELSRDPEYQRAERARGILRWDIDVAPGAVGAASFQEDYRFRLEFDRQMSLTGLPGQEG